MITSGFVLFILFLLIASSIYWADKKDLIDLGKWNNIITIAIAGVGVLLWLFPVLDPSPIALPPTNTPLGDRIELFAPVPYDYDGARDSDANGGTGEVSVESEVREGQTRLSYRFDYDIPPEGYAGFNLQFPEPQDLSMYSAIQFTVRFQDQDVQFWLHFRDIYGNQEPPVLIGTGIYGNATTDTQTISIPLQEFHTIDLSKVTDIIFDIKSEIAQGSHRFTISDINFSR